ncbi:hypothetical protein Q1695_005520 [Nippostrongylus brasiliensis]|nr:hypothetical protein Q1695_005520 [Nippostrongylus brasiliensis]
MHYHHRWCDSFYCTLLVGRLINVLNRNRLRMPTRGRERERKRRRHRSDDDDDDSIFTGWKLGLVVGVIVVCFAMLYPTIIHPMLMSLIVTFPEKADEKGLEFFRRLATLPFSTHGFFRAQNSSAESKVDAIAGKTCKASPATSFSISIDVGGRTPPPPPVTPSRPPVHPGMGGGGGRPGGPGGRHDVHPAMRMAQQQAETQSSGRGMFTWMLPLYTVGVVVFLLYTLFKSKGKKKKRSRYDSSDYSSDDGDEYNDSLKKKIGKRKLRSLQERLQQTEEAMTKILEQLEAVQTAGALVEGEQIKKEGKDAKETSSEAPKEANAKNEQYINDLEQALRDFKILSEAYEGEKAMRRRGSETDEDQTSSEELNSQSDESDEEDDEEVAVDNKKKNKPSNPEASEEETELPNAHPNKVKIEEIDNDEEESAAVAPAESTIEPKRARQSRNVRRRAKKV